MEKIEATITKPSQCLDSIDKQAQILSEQSQTLLIVVEQHSAKNVSLVIELLYETFHINGS